MNKATDPPPRPEGVSAREPIDEVVELLSMTFLYEQGRFLTVLGKMILWFVLFVIVATLIGTYPGFFDAFIAPAMVQPNAAPNCAAIDHTLRLAVWWEMVFEGAAIIFLGSALFSYELAEGTKNRLQAYVEDHRQKLQSKGEATKLRLRNNMRELYGLVTQKGYLRIVWHPVQIGRLLFKVVGDLEYQARGVSVPALINALASSFPGGIMGLASFVFFSGALITKATPIIYSSPVISICDVG